MTESQASNAKMDHLFSYKVGLKIPPEMIGPVPEGIRVNIYLTGGEVSGARCKGKLLQVGADWLVIRKDGVGIVDVRATIEMENGALVYAAYTGIIELGPNGYEAFLSGDIPAKFPIRTCPRYLTSSPEYEWMNCVQAYGIGEVDLFNGVVHAEVYAAL
jgi:Protein of unknown function (DUF3237)